MTTSPNDIAIRQGQEMLVPARIKSTTGYSNDVINITLTGNNKNNYDMAPGFNSTDLHVAIQRNQPPLFRWGANVDAIPVMNLDVLKRGLENR